VVQGTRDGGQRDGHARGEGDLLASGAEDAGDFSAQGVQGVDPQFVPGGRPQGFPFVQESLLGGPNPGGEGCEGARVQVRHRPERRELVPPRAPIHASRHAARRKKDWGMNAAGAPWAGVESAPQARDRDRPRTKNQQTGSPATTRLDRSTSAPSRFWNISRSTRQASGYVSATAMIGQLCSNISTTLRPAWPTSAM